MIFPRFWGGLQKIAFWVKPPGILINQGGPAQEGIGKVGGGQPSLASFRLSFQSENMRKRGFKDILDGFPCERKHHKQKEDGNPDISKSWKRGS
jgi:hypothetical protein